MIASALYSQQGLAADLATQCMLGVPSYDRPLVEGRPGDLPVTINADHAKGNYPDNAVFTGNVDINQGNSRLRADEVQLHQQQAAGQAQPVRTVDALGNVHYDDNQVILKGPKAWSNLNTKDTNVWQGDYQMVGRQGRGTADLMKQRGENRYTILENGSFTLGVCLIAAGIFFLLAYFVPGVDWKLMLKIAPAAGLILLGGEVLFFAARPGRWKYDFWSVLICLVLMAGCFGLSLLPVVWDELGPERNQASMKLGQEYTTEAYDKIKQTAPDIRVKNISGNAYLYSSEAKTLRDVNAGNGYLSLTVELFGGYDSVQAFAQDCRSVTDAVQQCSAQPDELRITWSPENDPGQSLASGSLQNVEQYTLELEGIAQLDWTADQMAKQTEVQYLLDEENEETAESEAFSEESAELSK